MAAGNPDGYRGETLQCCIVLKPGETASADEMISQCKVKPAAYKVPTLVEFRDELPETAVGKILRKILREEEAAKRKSQT